jgi:uncharacterized protein YdeI (YjbR/CyaY-like superfamily)
MIGRYEQVQAQTRAQWRDWLACHHATSPGIWLVTWKKTSGRPHLAYADIVGEALAFGWVDSRPRGLDDQRSALLVTPRQPGSNWSRLNKQRVERLTAAGLMQPAGLAAVAAAKANGTWNALNEVETLAEPADFGAALDADPAARRHWDAFPRSARRAILEWIGNARTSATRQARIDRTASDAARDIRANQWRQPGSHPGPGRIAPPADGTAGASSGPGRGAGVAERRR